MYIEEIKLEMNWTCWISKIIISLHLHVFPFLLHLQVTINEATGLPPTLCNYVFCQYILYDQPLTVVPPIHIATSRNGVPKSNAMQFQHSQVCLLLLPVEICCITKTCSFDIVEIADACAQHWAIHNGGTAAGDSQLGTASFPRKIAQCHMTLRRSQELHIRGTSFADEICSSILVFRILVLRPSCFRQILQNFQMRWKHMNTRKNNFKGENVQFWWLCHFHLFLKCVTLGLNLFREIMTRLVVQLYYIRLTIRALCRV